MQFQWWHPVVAIISVFLMWMGGLIEGFWATLGILGAISILAFSQFLPDSIRKFSAYIFIGWIIFSVVGPHVMFSQRLPILSEALQRRALDSELKAAVLSEPTALRGRLGLARYCQLLDEMQGEWIAQRLEHERNQVLQSNPVYSTKPPVPDKKNIKNILTWLAETEKSHEECKLQVAQIGKTQLPSSEKGFVEKFRDFFMTNLELAIWAVALLLVAALIAAVVTGKMGIWQAAKVAAGIITAAILFTVLIPELRAAWSGFKDQKGLQSAPASGSQTAGTRLNFPELCPDESLYLPLKKDYVANWKYGDRVGCRVEKFHLMDGTAEVTLTYVSGRVEPPQILKNGDSDFTVKERIGAISLKGITDVTYRAY